MRIQSGAITLLILLGCGLFSLQPVYGESTDDTGRAGNTGTIPDKQIDRKAGVLPKDARRNATAKKAGSRTIRPVGSASKPRLDKIGDALKNRRQKQRAGAKHRKRVTPDPVSVQATPQSSTGLRPISIRNKSGKVRAVKGELPLPASANRSIGQRPVKADIDRLLSAQPSLFGHDNGPNKLRFLSSEAGNQGSQHFKYQRHHKDLPVWGQELVVNTKADQVYLVNGDFNPIDGEVDTSVFLEEAEIQAITLSALERGIQELATINIQKLVFTFGPRTQAVFKANVMFEDYDTWTVFVDPRTHRVIHKIHTVRDASQVEASGVDLLGETRTFTATEDEGTFGLYDPAVPSGGSTVYDGRTDEVVQSSSATSGWDPTGVSVFTAQREIYDYLLDTFNRDSLDGKGIELATVIHLPDELNNAAWNGVYMLFGDGDGETIAESGFAGCIDVMAHEMVHGLNSHTANMIYENQSGALDESFADVFGTMVDREDWLLSEDCWLTSPGYLRSLEDPGSGADWQPSHMSEYQQLSLYDDNGGVHTNSGIPNYVAYQIATEIGREATEQIYYQALLSLTRNAQFLDARIATVAAAEAIYGEESSEALAVTTAWDTAGVTEDLLPSGSGGTDTIENIEGDDTMVYLYPFDGTHDLAEGDTFDLYLQVLSNPFAGYNPEEDFGPINSIAIPAYTRPAPATEDGELWVYYVAEDGNVYITGAEIEERLTDDGGYNALAVSPDANLIALTLDNDPNVHIYNFETDEFNSYLVKGPDFSQDDSESTEVTRVDAVSFDYASQQVIFDFATCLPSADAPCDSADAFEYWSIGVFDTVLEKFDYPFPAQSSDLDIGFPRFASNTNRYFVYDLIDWTDFDTTDSTFSAIYQYDSQTGESEFVINTNPTDAWYFTFGLPSYSGDDDYLVFQAFDDLSGQAYRLDLNDYVPDGDSLLVLSPFDVAMPVAHRNAERVINADLYSSIESLDLGVLAQDELVELDVTLTNEGNRSIDITRVTAGDALSHNLTNGSLAPDEVLTFTFSIQPAETDRFYDEVLLIEHTGDSRAVTIGISAAVGEDFDVDGVPDFADLFPEDPGESSDNDLDGIGDNADLDDDNDDIEDTLDDFPYSNIRSDFDYDGQNQALTDGLILVRYLFGFTGAALFEENGDIIEENLDQSEAGLYDIDGDGRVGALTDGLLLMRALFGFTGDELTAGAVTEDCVRCEPVDVAEYLETLL